MRVIIVSADERARSLVSSLHDQGIRAEVCDNLCNASESAKLYDIDTLLFDAALREVDCSTVATFRLVHKTVPILILGTQITEDQTISYFAAGTDDIVAWSCRADVMAARVRAIVRRYRGADPAVWAMGPLRFDMIRRSLKLDDIPITLTSKEYDVLEAMVLRKGVTLTKDVLLDQLYGGRDAPNERTIDVFVCKLRKKLAARGIYDLIETVRGAGYLLNESSRMPSKSMVRPPFALTDATNVDAEADATYPV